MPQSHILVVDDDEDLRAVIGEHLTGHGMSVLEAATGAEMTRAIRSRPVDLIILDLKLAREDGLDLLRALRGLTSAPVIIVTGHRNDEADTVLGLELGADDYLAKPLGLQELLARIRVVLRRANAADRLGAARRRNIRYRFLGWELDTRARQLTAPDGTAQRLTLGEFKLLVAFLDAPRQVLSRERLLTASRGDDQEVYDRSIDVLILRLRRKLEPDPSQPTLIYTERGAGYVFAAEVEVLQATAAPGPAGGG